MTTARFGARVCPACHGMWVERETWDAIVRLTEYVGRTELPTPDARELPRGAPGVACLMCGAPCERIFSWAGGVEVDHCPPHGLWFDRDELQTILHAVARWTRQARAGMGSARGAGGFDAADVGVSEGFVEVGGGGGEPGGGGGATSAVEHSHGHHDAGSSMASDGGSSGGSSFGDSGGSGGSDGGHHHHSD
jgi:Zn-finger nucleic acid-binding protein